MNKITKRSSRKVAKHDLSRAKRSPHVPARIVQTCARKNRVKQKGTHIRFVDSTTSPYFQVAVELAKGQSASKSRKRKRTKRSSRTGTKHDQLSAKTSPYFPTPAEDKSAQAHASCRRSLPKQKGTHIRFFDATNSTHFHVSADVKNVQSCAINTPQKGEGIDLESLDAVKSPDRPTSTEDKSVQLCAKTIPQKRKQRTHTKLLDSTKSPYFTTAIKEQPALSVWAAVTSLGPLVKTWCTKDVCLQPCQRGQGVSVCLACMNGVIETLAQFCHCSEFGNLKVDNVIEVACHQAPQPEPATSCIELVGSLIEKQTRHLCQHGCYLRAFAPCRERIEWFKFIEAKIDQPIEGAVIQTWACKLEPPSGAQPSLVSKRKETPAWLPKVVFLDPSTGKTFRTKQGTLNTIKESIELSYRESKVAEWHRDGFGCAHPRARAQQKTNIHQAASTMNSPLGLLEELVCDDPWKLLLCTMFLNRTRRTSVDKKFFDFLKLWPTPEALQTADVNEVSNLLRSLGLHNTRAKNMLRFAFEFPRLESATDERGPTFFPSYSCILEGGPQPACFEWTREEVKSLPGCGDYAADAYQIFIQQNIVEDPISNDPFLQYYVQWKRCQEHAR